MASNHVFNHSSHLNPFALDYDTTCFNDDIECVNNHTTRCRVSFAFVAASASTAPPLTADTTIKIEVDNFGALVAKNQKKKSKSKST
eukprot:m.117259 g.117259  ORF g.117259 m.117259 type:complete len:87 (-) comp28568_c0_seq1:54-314(-)